MNTEITFQEVKDKADVLRDTIEAAIKEFITDTKIRPIVSVDCKTQETNCGIAFSTKVNIVLPV